MAWFKCMGGEINPIYEEEKHTLVYTLQAGGQWEYFTNPNPDSGLLLYEITDEYNNVVLSIKKKTDDLAIYSLYTTIGVFDTNKSINVARTSDNATIYVSVNTTFTGYYLKVYTFAEEVGGTAFLKGTSDISSAYGDNGMVYLKYLDIEQFYDVKEYIEVGTTAGPYIDTGLTTSSNVTKLTTEAEITYSYNDRPDNNTWMFGAFSGYGIILGYQNGQTEGYVGSGGLLAGYDTGVHTIQFKNGSIYADDVLKQTGNWTQIPDNIPIYIFSRGGDNPVIKNTRIYRCKIWQNGELLRDFIPVQRKSDDEVGMLDIVNNVFYTNDGTGSFSCGGTSEITKPIMQSYVKDGTWKELTGENIDKVNCKTEFISSIDVSYIKGQIKKTRTTPDSNMMQVEEFYLYQNAEKYTWSSGVSITSDLAGVSGETIDKLIDGNISTKYNTSQWGSSAYGECNIVINLGETITLSNTSSYAFVTANDANSRDPVSWILYGSADGTNWIKLDERYEADVPTGRYTQTISFPMVTCGPKPNDDLLQFGQYAKFDGTQGITLPWTLNEDYKVEVVFMQTEYTSAENIIGNSIGASYSQLTVYENKYYVSQGTYETSFGTWSAGEHIFVTNNGNGYNEFDGVEVQSYVPTTGNNTYYTIGIRSGAVTICSYIKSYRIYSLSENKLLHELLPVLYGGQTPYLYDTVDKVFYSSSGISEIVGPLTPASIPSNCTKAEGSFTTGSTIDSVVEIDCGFEPDFIKVLMEFGTSQTTAYYFKTGNEDNEEISVWDLRPTEGAIYQIFEPSGPASSETGICEITSTGFKYKAHGGNTTSKACTYVAYKFNESLPEFDEDAFYQYGTWLHPEDMTMTISDGAVDTDGSLLFSPTTNIGGISTDTIIDEGSYRYVFFVENVSSTSLQVQYGASTPGYDVNSIIGTGTGRQTYAGATLGVGKRSVYAYDINHSGGNSGVFIGMYPTGNSWKITKILRIPL